MYYDILEEISEVLSESSSVYTMMHLHYITPRKVKNRVTTFASHNPMIDVICLTWSVFGKYHRDGDKPAFVQFNDIWSSGSPRLHLMRWFQHGLLHRPSGKYSYFLLQMIAQWYDHGEVHRGDGLPARYSFNCKSWYTHDKCLKRTGYGPGSPEVDTLKIALSSTDALDRFCASEQNVDY